MFRLTPAKLGVCRAIIACDGWRAPVSENEARLVRATHLRDSIRMSFVQCGNAVHFYRRRPSASVAGSGAAMTLVLVNGLGTDHRIWDDVVTRLPARWDVLSYDLRGHGLTEVGDTPYDVAGLSADLDGLLDRLGIGAAVVCGLSVGGLVAQGLALSHPRRVRALCLCGTAPRIGTAASWQSRIDQVRAGGLTSIAGASMERWFTESFRQQHPTEVRGYRAMLERTPVEGYLAMASALAHADLGAKLHAIAVPTLVIAGELDVATPPDAVQRLAELIPGAKFHLLEGAGHLMNVERPDALVSALRELVGQAALLGDTGIG